MIYIDSNTMKPIEVEPGLFGVRMIDGSVGSHNITLLRGWLLPGARHSMHRHDSEEAVVFLSGHGVVCIDGKRREVKSGDAINILPSVPHSTENNHDNEELHFISAFSDSIITSYPVGENYQRGVKYITSGSPTLNKLRWIFRKIFRIFRNVIKIRSDDETTVH